MEQVTEKYMTLFPINSLSEYVLHPIWVGVAVSILMQSLEVPEQPRQHDSAKEAPFISALVVK